MYMYIYISYNIIQNSIDVLNSGFRIWEVCDLEIWDVLYCVWKGRGGRTSIKPFHPIDRMNEDCFDLRWVCGCRSRWSRVSLWVQITRSSVIPFSDCVGKSFLAFVSPWPFNLTHGSVSSARNASFDIRVAIVHPFADLLLTYSLLSSCPRPW